MKSLETLKRYEKGEREFSGVNLRGQNFERKDLSGANFSGADLRGANFSYATLQGTNFTNVKTGARRSLIIGQVIILLLLSMLSGFLAGLPGCWLLTYMAPITTHFSDTRFSGYTSCIIIIAFFVTLHYKGIVTATSFLAVSLVVLSSVAALLNLMGAGAASTVS
jgi:hypothetical protein